MNRFFKNFILYGDIDFCCVLCNEAFDTLDSAEKHIRWEQHRKLLRSQVKMTKFKKDSIYKIDDIYYCEDCNRVLTSIAEIKQHIEDAKHIQNKANPVVELPKTICQREPGNSGLILIGNLKVTTKEWNGIVDSKCVLCDKVVDNFVKHITVSRHVINLIHSEICTAEGEQHYRKINEICYCFMCKATFPTSAVNEHWLDQHHLEKIRATIQSLEEKIKSDRAHFEKKLEVAVQLIDSQKKYFDIDVENKVAICKICTSFFNINFLQMIQHRKTHNVTSEDDIAAKARAHMNAAEEKLKKHKQIQKKDNLLVIFDHGKRRSELAKFGRDNYMKLVPPGGKGYCSLCNMFVSAHINNFTQHANGLIHKGHLRLKERDEENVNPEYNTKRLRTFLESVVHAEPFKILWINQCFGLDMYSFMLISIIDKKAEHKKIICYACGITFDHGNAREHCLTEQHKEIFISSRVITTIDDEFIREVQPNLYHCGFCNLTFPYSDPLEKHLYSWKHLFIKSDREVVHNLTRKYYEDIVPPNFNYERVYSHLMNIII
ncbi:uncharacterized protein [Choristoneura fumiferana]|uniref:uncharacterized protein n=1 Tax=Choristoneura fumiferana TaxID=7141 RepID=UPI003D15D3BE